LTVAIVKNSIKLKGDYFYELLPGVIPAFIAVVVVSLVTERPSETVLQKFDGLGNQPL
jgi:sodium/proline symporter